MSEPPIHPHEIHPQEINPHASPLPLWSNLHADAIAHIAPERRHELRGGPMAIVLRMLVKSPGMRCAAMYRLSHTVRARVPVIGRIVSGLLFWIGRHWYTCSIAGTARIGGGLILPHPQGIVIGGEVCIGECAWIFQNVTIGGAPGKRGMPSIGRDARLFANAVLAGPIRIGDDVWIGANAAVSTDVPNLSVARCEKAVILPRKDRFVQASEGTSA